MTSSAFDAWKNRARDTPIATAIGRLGLKLHKVTPNERAGPCPRPGCGGDDRFRINLKKHVYLCRQCGGGGVIDLVMMARGVEFLAACEILTGEPPPARDSQVTDADRERWAKEEHDRAELAAKRAREENEFRLREIGRLREMWARARPIAGTPAEAYLRLRLPGIVVPDTFAGRCILDMPYYSGNGDHGEVLAHAPVFVLAYTDAAGDVHALHLTYIDLTRPKGKLDLVGADGKPLAAKKMRGSVKGNKLELIPCANLRQLVMGEGTEKTLAVWMALAADGRVLSSTAFWSAGDLGNLTGRAAGRGRAKLADPHPDDPGITIPDSVEDLVLLGDSTSEPFTTQCAMYRAQQRYAKPGRMVRVLWAPEGKDFDDVVREAA